MTKPAKALPRIWQCYTGCNAVGQYLGNSISVFTPVMSRAEVVKLAQIVDNVEPVNRHQAGKIVAEVFIMP